MLISKKKGPIMNPDLKCLLVRGPIAYIAGAIDGRLAPRGFAEKPNAANMIVPVITDIAMQWSSYFVEKTIQDILDRD